MNLFEVLSHPYTGFLARLIIGTTFLFAGITKMRQAKKLEQRIADYEILPRLLLRPFAISLPWLEIGTGLGLIFGFWTIVLAYLAEIMLFTFTLAIGISIGRGKEIDCNCFGNLHSTKVGLSVLVRNIALIICTLLIILFYEGYFSLEAWLFGWSQSRIVSADGLIFIILAGLLIILSVAIVRQTFLNLNQGDIKTND